MFLDIRKSGLKQALENWHFLAIIENNNEKLPLEMYFIFKSAEKTYSALFFYAGSSVVTSMRSFPVCYGDLSNTGITQITILP